MDASSPIQYRNRTYRGSRKRIQRIRMRDHTPRAFLLWASLIAAGFVGAIVWLMEHPWPDGH